MELFPSFEGIITCLTLFVTFLQVHERQDTGEVDVLTKGTTLVYPILELLVKQVFSIRVKFPLDMKSKSSKNQKKGTAGGHCKISQDIDIGCQFYDLRF